MHVRKHKWVKYWENVVSLLFTFFFSCTLGNLMIRSRSKIKIISVHILVKMLCDSQARIPRSAFISEQNFLWPVCSNGNWTQRNLWPNRLQWRLLKRRGWRLYKWKLKSCNAHYPWIWIIRVMAEIHFSPPPYSFIIKGEII